MNIYVEGIEVSLVRKNVKNINLTVLPPDGRVRVSAPRFVPTSKVVEFVSSKLLWIIEKREALAALDIKECNYENGETLFVLGNPYVLVLDTAAKRGSVNLCENKMFIGVCDYSDAGEIKRYYDEYLRSVLSREIEYLLPIWEERTGLHPSAWSIRDMSTRWGSCNTETGKLNFALGLGKKDTACIEYVILHELTHLRERGHGERFCAVMDEYMPNWRDIKQKLNAREKNDEG